MIIACIADFFLNFHIGSRYFSTIEIETRMTEHNPSLESNPKQCDCFPFSAKYKS